jgi:putative endonuclease
MAGHIDTGMEGELLACEWLSANGYEILHRNWRYGHLEIDIIARKGSFLHFVEVKTRYQQQYGNPEDQVTRAKFKKLQKAAHEYIIRNPGHPWFQYDIIAVTLRPPDAPEIFLLSDVFL